MKQTIQITILDNGYLLEHSTGAAPVRKMAFESIDTLLETLGDIFDAEVTVKGAGKAGDKELDEFFKGLARVEPIKSCTNESCPAIHNFQDLCPIDCEYLK